MTKAKLKKTIEVEVRRKPFGPPYDIKACNGSPQVLSVHAHHDGHAIVSAADGREYRVDLNGVGFWRVVRPAVLYEKPPVEAEWQKGVLNYTASMLGRELGIISRAMKKSTRALEVILDKTGRLF